MRFERSPVFVDVSYEPQRSHELSAWIGITGDPEPPFELADVLRATGCPKSDVASVAIMQTGSIIVLRRLLRRVARLMDSWADAFLLGDREAFEDARTMRSDRARQYTSHIVTGGQLSAADAAWSQEDYARVHALLYPIRDRLNKHHLHRLQFAERRLRRDDAEATRPLPRG
jgi:hypothetical protein